jgi:hypothetical protein
MPIPKETEGDVATKLPGKLLAMSGFLGILLRSLFWRPAPRKATKVNLSSKVLAILYESNREYTFSLLLERLHRPSTTALTSILADLIYDHKVEKVIRIESPAGGGLGEFKSFDEIPNTIFDWRTDRMMRVHPDNLVTIFRGLQSQGDQTRDVAANLQNRGGGQDARKRA